MGMEQADRSFAQGMKANFVVEQLRRSILDGSWVVGARIPTEPALAETYGVSINTVRRAVGALAEEQVLERRQGSGTYVLRIPPSPEGSARLVGMLVPSTAYFYPRIIQGAERALSARNVGLLLASSEYSLSVERDQISRLIAGGVEGLILVPNLHLLDDPQRFVDGLRDMPVPYVLAERKPPAPDPDDDTSYVISDHEAGAYSALRHLRELGHRRIGFLGRLRTGTADAVSSGFERAVAGLGLRRIDDAVVRRAEWGTDEIDDYAASCRRHGVTAVFCHGDDDAARLVARVQRTGSTVPGDLAVVAYDDEATHLSDTPLTSVAPPKAAIGVQAARTLLNRLDDPDFPAVRMSLLPRLIIRESCGGLATPAAVAVGH